MSGFTKLFSSITESSVWVADDKTLRVWVALLARCDAKGIVEGSVPGFASLCRMTIEEFEERIRILSAPDRYSRTPDNEGRRIQSVEGGWRVVNYGKYREKGQSKAGSSAEKVREWRAKKKAEVTGLHVTGRNSKPLRVRQEAEAEAENTPLPPEGNGELFGDPAEKSFEAFLSLYPRGEKKKEARKAWKRIPSREHAAIMEDLRRRLGSPEWLREGGRFVPYPSTYLNQERWREEPATTAKDVSQMTDEEILRRSQA